MKFSVKLPNASEMLKDLGLEEGGRVQKFFTNEVMRLSDDYVPMDTGTLKNNVSMKADNTGYIYNSIYARYQWYGNLMVDPDYLVGAFPLTQDGVQVGFYSRKGVPKILDPSGRKLNNQNGKRGSEWVARMWQDKGDNIVNSVEQYIKQGR